MKKVKTYQSVSPQVIQEYAKYIGASMLPPQLLNNPHISFNVFDNGYINYRNHYAFNSLQRTTVETEQQAREVIAKFIADYRKNIQQFIEWKKVDESFPVLFHRYLKPISSSQVFNKESKSLQYWIINYIAEFDSVIDEDSKVIRTSSLNNENVSFYVGGQGQVIGLNYNHLPFNKIIITELMNVIASTESPNIVYKRNLPLNLIAAYYANENFELLPASSKSIEQPNTPPKDKPTYESALKANLFPAISIRLIDQSEETKKDPNTNKEFDSVTHIYSFISLVEEIEKKFSATEQKNTAFMITQFRKAFYNSDNWNTRLIPHTDTELLKSKITDEDKKKLRANRMVRELDSAKIDIGHVFVGMDAFNHQGNIVSPNYAYWIDIYNSLDAATWLGDLGSVIAYV